MGYFEPEIIVRPQSSESILTICKILHIKRFQEAH